MGPSDCYPDDAGAQSSASSSRNVHDRSAPRVRARRPLELQQHRLRVAGDHHPPRDGCVLRRLPEGSRLSAARHAHDPHHLRSGHHSEPSGRVSPGQRHVEESGLGVAVAQHDGGRSAVFLRPRPGAVGDCAEPLEDPEPGRARGDLDPVRLNDGGTFPYGFGWQVAQQRGYRRIGHGGAWQGFRTAIQRYPDFDLTAIVLDNLEQSLPEAMAVTIAGILEPRLTPPHMLRRAPSEVKPPQPIDRLLQDIAAGVEARKLCRSVTPGGSAPPRTHSSPYCTERTGVPPGSASIHTDL